MAATPAVQKMIDNGDGTYSGSYKSNVKGTLTVTVYLYSSGVYAEYYNNKLFTAPIAQTGMLTNINQDWGTGAVFSTNVDNLSARIYFLIKGPYTENIDFWLESNDGSDLYVDNTVKVTQLGNSCPGSCNDQFSVSMVAGTYYEFRYLPVCLILV